MAVLANRVKLLRQSKKMSQSQLADRLGVKKQTVSNWENDNIMPSVEMVVKVADYFNVSTDYLLGRDEAARDGAKVMDMIGLSDEQFELVRKLVEQLRGT